jgi:hypothetical protein
MRPGRVPFALLVTFLAGVLAGSCLSRLTTARLSAPIRTPYDVAARLGRLEPTLRTVHPAREGLSPGLYFTVTPKCLDDLMRLPRGGPYDSPWEGTVYCTVELEETETADPDACRLGEAPGLLFYGDPALLRRIARALR